MDWSLFDPAGHRKYLTEAERRAFIKAAKKQAPEVYTLCLVLKDTGCRLSEALGITADHVDLRTGVIVFRSLKKRRANVHRAIPVSPALLAELDRVHAVRKSQSVPDCGATVRLWPWHRMTAHRRIKEVMVAANVHGPHATAKGLRHGFGVAALERGIPITLLQKWLGHAKLATTAIYGDAVGAEERRMARKLWD
jgi:integrase